MLREIIGYLVDFLQAIIYYFNIMDDLFRAYTEHYHILLYPAAALWDGLMPGGKGLSSCSASSTSDQAVLGCWGTHKIPFYPSGLCVWKKE